jgi:peptidoglycan hydrolase-like protein with peptidoglycan-binding domain
VRAHAGPGARGSGVRALQSRLKKLGYLVKASGRYNGTTGRAVLAFRKVNGMARNTVANRAVYRKLAKGRGGFKLRYPKAGKHVEFDWSRQVVVLARGSRPVMTIHTSSGAPSTPTGFGKFRFWLKQAGYNQKRMYFTVYFNGGEGIHGFDPVPNGPASHGCLRIPIPNAIRVYNWIDLGNVIYSYK